ncbi:hypothetical protein OG689_44230 [Kitasatospora sp. NBC_00240]|uniref:hypothetical protein n=1 Tax=Kitasatospora sp. NBC_00240 TaxID=2903567 RepID=UPI002251C375|nr:hypothetical protein [Kitasatospora sp. NBC_00240]MCX5216146.1 hypothetical protein [Kitasatospora sp. NBC_00240]
MGELTRRPAEISYSQVLETLARLAAATLAEEHAARQRFERVAAKVADADRTYHAVRMLGFDPFTLGDIQQVGQSLVGQATAVMEAANSAIELNAAAHQAGRNVQLRHGSIDAAVASAPVPAANREAYNNRL